MVPSAIDEFVPFGSADWGLLAGLLVFGRSCDLLSTYLATPHLILEGNPLAKKLGWRIGIPVNGLMVVLAAAWPLLALSLTTTSLFVAARNLQSAWLMRSMGETEYRLWMTERVMAGPRHLAWMCFLGEAMLVALVGACLMWFSRWQLVPFGIGLGITSYGAAVAVFTSLSLWRSRS